MSKPYTIRLFMPEGNPNSFKIIDKMNWTGVGLAITRDSWSAHNQREEFQRAGVYVLIGYQEDDDMPTLYIGQGDGVKNRIDSHEKNKEFWDRALVFVSSNNGLNRAHITWLEWALISRAKEIGRCKLDNSVSPNEPGLSESDKADIQEFFNEILSVLPLVELRVFEPSKKISPTERDVTLTHNKDIKDTIIVPAQEDGFNEVFLGEDCWHAIRIGGGKLHDIKYIAAYQSAPISAVTHYAEVDSIEPYGDGGKYQLNFKGSAQAIGPIVFGNAKTGSMQGARYTAINKLKSAECVDDLF